LTGSNLEFSSLKNGTVMDLKLCIQQEISLDPEEQALFLNGGADGAEVYFKIKRSTPLRKLMDAYCKKQFKPYLETKRKRRGK